MKELGVLYFVVVFLFLYSLAGAQEHHAQFHEAYYKNWVNQRDKGCCNDQDCGLLRDEDERETAAGVTEVRIDGTWCKVEPWHYLKHGNAPNWASSHICVVKNVPNLTPMSPCERLLCYQPKPGT